MIQIEKRTSTDGNILVFLLIIISIVSSTPLLQKSIWFIIPGLISIYFVIRNRGSRNYNRNKTLVFNICAYIVFIVTYKLVGVSSAEWGQYTPHSFFFLTIMIMLLLQNELSYKQMNWAWWGIIIAIMINVIDNIRLSIIYPWLNLYNHSVDPEFYASINAGGSKFYTFTLFFFLVVFFVFLNTPQKKVKRLMFGCSFLTAIYICVFCMKAAIIIFLLLSVILLYCAKKVHKLSVFLSVGAVLGLLTLLLRQYYSDTIIDTIISLSPSDRLSGRLILLVNSKDEEAMGVSIDERESLWMLSVDTWLTDVYSVFFGIGDRSDTLASHETGIGRHSDFIDSLAKYGIIGCCFIVVILIKSFQAIMSCFDKRYKLQLMVIFFITILCGFTKGIFFSGLGLTLYIMLPLAATFVNNNKSHALPHV